MEVLQYSISDLIAWTEEEDQGGVEKGQTLSISNHFQRSSDQRCVHPPLYEFHQADEPHTGNKYSILHDQAPSMFYISSWILT